ncbi:Crp/Fnr family transcriptional regulator [Haliangium sp.]
MGTIPLFRGFTDAQLDEIMALFGPVAVDGELLFNEGDAATTFFLLIKGEVVLRQDGLGETYHLHPLSVIGELGSLCGLPRHSSATLGPDTELLQCPVTELEALFAKDPPLGLRLQKNLLELASDKIQRDQVRLQDMRANIIHTQRAMKRMRDFLLASEDTKVSSPLHDVIEELIRRNRRVNYRVSPPLALTAGLRLDGDTQAKVIQLSRSELTVEGIQGAEGDRISGVLQLSGPEIPVSGRITSVADGRVEIQLDLLMEEYAAGLEGYLTRVQMLDFLV